ncbi:MAG TPA: 2Fe-2S iron-sulfur cluster-binding protein [Paracoccaceae bacterium]|nr:2Fe-2S iron-sulfur cluster-binding protein [Paracoccaceae bacterium]
MTTRDGPGPVHLIVNGQSRAVDADRDTPLLSVLRDDLGLLGTRTGCLEGRCGSCTVHVDGRAVQTCTTPLWSVAGRQIDTIDGAAPGSAIARVRDAFLDEQAAQCGYCVNGIIMTIASLIAGPAVPDRGHILTVLDERHLCRCGAHPRMLRALDRLLADAAA